MTNLQPSPSLSSLPDVLIEKILARISKSQYRSLSLVSKTFHSLLSSPELYTARSQSGNVEPRLYVCLQVPKTETTHHRWFTITNFDQTLMSNKKGHKLSLKRVKHCGRDRLNSTSVAVGNEIYQMGGSKKNMLSRFVYVVDCRSHKRRRAPKMMVPRKRAKSCFQDGKIYVVGGCRKTEEPMNWGEVFDLKTQTWKPFPSPTNNLFDQDHKFLVFSGKLYIMTMDQNYEYDPKEGRWNKTLELSDCAPLPYRVAYNYPRRITGWCVIENVTFAAFGGNYYWYDSNAGYWRKVEGLEDIYIRFARNGCALKGCCKLQLVNYGGKLVIIWHECVVTAKQGETKGICYAVIRLEKRLNAMWGIIEKFNVLSRVPDSCKLLSSLSVSL